MNVDNRIDRNLPIVGYARVSTADQCLDLQMDCLNTFGCTDIFYDEGISGGTHPKQREGFIAARNALCDGGVFVVWKLDRLGRSLKSVIDTVDGFKCDNIAFVSLTESIDTTTATGRAFWQFIGLMAELERGLISERTIEGMAAARRRGVKFGRPRKLSDGAIQKARRRIERGEATISSVAKRHGVNPATVRRALATVTTP